MPFEFQTELTKIITNSLFVIIAKYNSMYTRWLYGCVICIFLKIIDIKQHETYKK